MENEYQRWMREEYVPIMGGDDPPAGDPPDGGDPPANDPPGGGDPPAGDPPAAASPPQGGNWIPKQRFDQVNNNLRSYKEFGSPDEVKERLSRLSEWEKQVEEHRKREAMTQEQRDQAASRDEIRNQLLELLPELKDIEKIAGLEERTGKLTQNTVQKNLAGASTFLGEMLKNGNLDMDADTQDGVEDYLWVRMTEEEREAAQQGDYSGIEEAYKRESEKGLLSKLKPLAAPTPIPRRHRTGGTPPPKPKDAVKTFSEAEKIAEDRLGLR